MKASLRSVRTAPKKAQVIAKMIRGKPVPEALEVLEKTNKKAARLLENLLQSAMANASNNDNQDPQMLVIRTLTVNQAQAYHRGIPMARGRVRRIRKFLSHIHLVLGVGVGVEDGPSSLNHGGGADESKSEKTTKEPSQKAKTHVKKARSSMKKATSSKSKSAESKSPKKETASDSKSSKPS